MINREDLNWQHVKNQGQFLVVNNLIHFDLNQHPTFVPDDQSVFIPEENFYMVSMAVEKNKKCPRQKFSRKQSLDGSAQTFEAFAHIDGELAEKQSSIAGNC
jgi:hypothetical protein